MYADDQELYSKVFFVPTLHYLVISVTFCFKCYFICKLVHVCRCMRRDDRLHNLQNQLLFSPQSHLVGVCYRKHVAVVYSQSKEGDYSSLKHLYSCFGLMYMDGYSPFGMYNGVTMYVVDAF